jgi:hypothetical protein
MLDDDGDGKVTVEDCVSAVQTIYQERSNLAASLKDTRSIASSLEVIIGVIIHLICVMVYFYILFSVTFNQIWAFVSTTILGLSFIFGQYIRIIFENTMFLFSSHPFDVGDMLLMNDNYLTVDEIQLNFTIFISSAGQRLWVPNQQLVTNPFVNLTTSGNKVESISVSNVDLISRVLVLIICFFCCLKRVFGWYLFYFHHVFFYSDVCQFYLFSFFYSLQILLDMDTPPGILDDIIAAMEALKEEMPQEFSSVSGYFTDAAVPMKMTLKLWIGFTHNGTNLVRCARARSKMYVCVAGALQKAGVAYTWPAMRTLNLPAGGNAGVGAAAADPNTSSIVGVL